MKVKIRRRRRRRRSGFLLLLLTITLLIECVFHLLLVIIVIIIIIIITSTFFLFFLSLSPSYLLLLPPRLPFTLSTLMDSLHPLPWTSSLSPSTFILSSFPPFLISLPYVFFPSPATACTVSPPSPGANMKQGEGNKQVGSSLLYTCEPGFLIPTLQVSFSFVR